MIHNNTSLLKYLILCSAILVVGLSGYFSVVGLSTLFQGKYLFAMLMAISFQISKITIISLLSQKWDVIAKSVKTFLIIATAILVMITSSGVYSYLADAYQITIHKASKITQAVDKLQTNKSILTQQKQTYLTNIKSIEQQINNINSMNNKLNDANKFTMQQRNIKTIAKLQQQKQDIYTDIQQIDSKILMLNDSTYTTKTSDKVGEVTPLIKISQLFNTTMDRVVQVLLSLIILLFDPLGIIYINLLNRNIFTKLKEETMQDNDQTKNNVIDLSNIKIENSHDEKIVNDLIQQIDNVLK